MLTLDRVLDEIAHHPVEEQQIISNILQKRLIDERREEIAKRLKEAKRNYKTGKTKRFSSVSELWKNLND